MGQEQERHCVINNGLAGVLLELYSKTETCIQRFTKFAKSWLAIT